MSKMLDEHLTGLSDEERAALVEDEGDDEANRALLKSLLNRAIVPRWGEDGD